MTVTIRHGAPGAYKTSTAVGTELMRWIAEGRTVVTNVRGITDTDTVVKNYQGLFKKTGLLSKLRLAKALPAPDPDFEIIYVDTESSAGIQKMREWFMWAPEGAAFLVDEIQTIYPQKFTMADYKKLAYPSTDEALKHKRPEDVFIAFEKHRHYNWDFVVTAPSIKKVPAIVRDIADHAFFHSNKAKIGIKGRYLEAMHNADDSGKNESHWLSFRILKAPKQAFALYESTATGAVTDTHAVNIFLQPKPMAVMIGMVCLFGYLISRGNPLKINSIEVTEENTEVQVSSSAAISPKRNKRDDLPELPPSESAVLRERRLAVMEDKARERDPGFLTGLNVLVGGHDFEPFVTVSVNSIESPVYLSDLAKNGYSLERISECIWKLNHRFDKRVIYCAQDDDLVIPRFNQDEEIAQN